MQLWHKSPDSWAEVWISMAVLKKKTMRLAEMLDSQLVNEGEMLRYKVIRNLASIHL